MDISQILYIYTYLKINSDFHKSLYFHLIPFFLIFSYTLTQSSKYSHVYKIFYLNPLGEVSLFGKIHSSIGILFAYYYLYLSSGLIKKNLNKMREVYSNLDYFQTLEWLKAMFYYNLVQNLLLFILRVILSFENSFKLTDMEIKTYYIFLQNFLFSANLYLLSYFVLSEQGFEEKIIFKKENLKYAKTGLEKFESEKLSIAIKELVNSKKLFLDEELRINDIAEKLDRSINHISQSLNENEDKNFYQFINDFRIEEVIQKFSDKSFQEHSILRIALDSGFNSKSSFNKVFKERTGISPKEYRAKLI